jgi:hypothetical protein
MVAIQRTSSSLRKTHSRPTTSVIRRNALLKSLSLIPGGSFAFAYPRFRLRTGAWIVQVVTRGGILGTGSGDFAVSSEGKISCWRDVRCPKDFRVSDLRPLIEQVQSGTLPAPVFPVVGFCSDCITRTITISRRDSMSIVHTYTASWDDTTKSRLPQEVVRIYDSIAALIK